MQAISRVVMGISLGAAFFANGFAWGQPTPAPLLQIEPALIEAHQVSGSTNAQGLSPYYVDGNADPYIDNRGTGLDGSLRSHAPFGWAVNANPYAHEWNDKARYRKDILLNNGRYSPTHVDLSLPAPGFSWTVGRTYSIPSDAPDYSSSYPGPQGYQGLDWHQFSQPEVVVSSNGTYIYLVYGADRFLEFKLVDGSSTVYRGVNGAAGAIVEGTAGASDEYDTLTYWDRLGTRSVFFHPDDSDNQIVVVNPDQTTDTYDARGQLWTITDAAGNQAYVGDDASAYSAIVNGYDDGARMQVAYDTAGRKYEYTYTTTAGTGTSTSLNADLLTKVEVFEDYDNDSIWETTGSKVEYSYLTDRVLRKGLFGNLKEAAVTIPLSGYSSSTPTADIVTTKQRYWYDTSGDRSGYLRAHVSSEGCRQFEVNETVTLDSLEYNSSVLRPYCEVWVNSFDADGRLYEVYWRGDPSTNGGRVRFNYEEYNTFTHASTTGVYDPEERLVVRVYQERGNVPLYVFHQYFDEAGQPLSRRVEASGNFPTTGAAQYPDMWVYVVREDPATTNSFDGMIWKIGWPLSLSSATPNPTGTSYAPPCIFKSTPTSGDNGGLVQVFDREDSTSSAFRGFMLADQWQHGDNPQDTADGPHPIYSYTYLTPARDSAAAVDVGGYLVIRPMLSSFKRHPGIDTGSGAPASEDTSYSYEFHAEDIGGGGTTDSADPQWLRERKVITTLPSVSTSQLGSGSSETTESYYRPDGTTVFYKAEDGIWQYTEHDRLLNVKTIEDVNLSTSGAFATGDAPANYMASVPSTTGAYHLVTECERDEMGRKTQVTLPTGRVQEAYHYAIDSGELTEVWSAKTSGGTHTGPAKYYAYDHSGHRIVNAEIAFSGGTTTSAQSTWIDDTATTPLVDAVDVGTISRADTVLMDPSGSVVYAERSYHTLPTSGIGERYNHFDERWHEYDIVRRTRGTVEMNGTIRTYSFDDYGMVDTIFLDSYDPGEGYVQEADPNDPGEEIESTCVEACCVEIHTFPIMGKWYAFIKGCDSSLELHSQLALTTAETGQTYMQGDLLGRTVFTVGPDVPYEYREYDNLGRLIAVATYKDIPSSLTEVSVLPTEYDRDNPDIFSNFDHRDFSPSTMSDNRMSLVEYEYTPRGLLYSATTYEVNQSTGALVSGSSIETVYAYDEVGRLIYTDSDQMIKRAYNRVGQLTDTYVVAVDDDTTGSYSDLFDVDGDVVVTEQHAAIDPETGNTHMVVRVDREPDISGQPQPLDALDGSDYSDVSTMFVDASTLQGRAQITTYSFDTLDRVTDRSVHGTGDTENNNDFDPDTPPTGSIEVTLTYGDDGRVVEVEDELGRVQTRSYDLAGKVTQTIDNYVASGTADDENRKTEWVYRNTQLYQYLAYLDSTTAQVTTYSYGSPHSDPRLPDIGDINPTNDLLRSITYPDGGMEEFFYNNYGTLRYHIDRHGNEFEVTFDDSHRPTMVQLVDAATAYSAEETKAIEITYTNRGRYNTLIEADTTGNGNAELSTITLGYDGWGALSSFKQQDNWLDDLVGSSVVKERAVEYAWEASASSGPSDLRLDTFTFEGDTSTATDDIDLVFSYTGGTNSGLSRVTSMALDSVNVAEYKYLGLDRVSRVEYPENDVYSELQNASHQYDALDRFNRVVRSRWNRTRTSNEVPFYDNQVHWDDGSNVTGITDHIHTDHYNFNLVNDDLNRLTQAKRGGGTGTVISNLREQEDWTLGKVGTWEAHNLDLNGDLDYSDAGEFQTDHTFDGTTPDLGINKLITIEQDTDNTAGYENTFTRSYDAAGNLTDAPDRNQEFVWDYLGRLIEVKADDGGTTRTVAEFRYNALGYRIAERLDSNGDGFLDKPTGAGGEGDDTVWRRLIYDARWRVVEVYEVESASGSEAETLAERFVHHGAGLNGVGTGSYIDELVLRDRDADGNGIPSTPSLEERHYYCQNWRADVVAIISHDGKQIEQTRYSAYGTPYSIPFADYNLDGEVNFFDVNPYINAVNAGVYDVRLDANLDGTLNFDDISHFNAQYNEIAGSYGRGVQSAYAHEPGYAGYWRIDQLRLSHVRNRWYDAQTGTWISKDPAGYVDSANLYGYVNNNPFVYNDHLGLFLNLFGTSGGHHGNYTFSGTGGRTSGHSEPFDGRAVQNEVDNAIDDAIYQTTEEHGPFWGTVHGIGLEIPNQLIVEPFTGLTTGNPVDIGNALLAFVKLKALGKGLEKCVKFFKRDCFVEGTLVTTADSELAIEDVQVGQVVQSSPDSVAEYEEPRWSLASVHADLVDPEAWDRIDPEQWSLVEMLVIFDSGLIRRITALRPDAWVGDLKQGDRVGYLSEGLGVIGEVEIMSISSCPELPEDTTGVVRATYETRGVSVVDLLVSGSAEPIGVTPGHALFSVDRGAWVRVDELWIGERLRSAGGDELVVEGVAWREGLHSVYNLEVHGDHTYYVGEVGLWAHNGGDINPPPPGYGFDPNAPVGPGSLAPGTLIDRYGRPGGSWGTSPGVAPDTLSPHPNTDSSVRTRYRVVRPTPVVDGIAAPWDWGDGRGTLPGGGQQYYFPESLSTLEDLGFVERVCP